MRGITRNIIILGIVSLFTDLSSQMVFPLIPLFLTSVIGAGAAAVGLVEGAAEATASLLKVVSGYWSDKVKRRKPFILFGYSLSTITKPLFAFAGGWISVLLIRVIERVGKGLRTSPRDALVAESTDEVSRGIAYGFHRTMDGAGSIMGAALAFLLLAKGIHYREIFLLALLPGAVSVSVIFLIREQRASSKPEHNLSMKRSFRELSWNLRLYIIAASIFALGHFGYAFLLLRAKDIGLSDGTAIFLYLIFYIVYTIFSTPSGALSDRVGRGPLVAGGYLLFGLVSLGLILISNFSGLLLIFILYGVCYAMIDGMQRAFVVDLAPEELKATALGAFHTSIGLSALPGGLIAGLLWDRISPEATFVYGIALTTVSLLMLGHLKRRIEQI
ncbi:MAG TPA: MFS transporter [Candidatus Syntrophoarchaeum butanivorans]|uniref:MFS transporter n=1 Tax=Candidatus Syntropharchaeum butanivorans TaxID=1839936 RepID=A0A1F2P604_9EURY|nr:MAG: MFS transporter permease [Candidatus Syntrophoarchaeum butanivorans]HEC57378.1 MFS transporter [Candidatus Syntrophoarchaeum butanivorans]